MEDFANFTDNVNNIKSKDDAESSDAPEPFSAPVVTPVLAPEFNPEFAPEVAPDVI